jgi:high frequency lysogenization protein
MNAQPMDDLTDYGSLALAGVVLAAELVQQTANGASRDLDSIRAVKRAIVSHNARALREVFPNMHTFRPGVTGAISALQGKPDNPEAVRYALQLVELAALLRRSPDGVERLRRALEALPAEPDDPQLANVYQTCISTLGKRIQVTGTPALLKDEAVADEIRALLLGGVRFAWLWRQLGGRRWHLVLKRKSLLHALQALDTILRSTMH